MAKEPLSYFYYPIVPLFLGWEPRIGLEEGLEKTIKYFERLLSMG
jgi:hypothetical protein